MPVDSRDEELTLENVDELVAQKLLQLQASQPPTMTSLSRTVRNLQIIYEEKRRVERVWERINDRAFALDLTVSLDSSDAIKQWSVRHRIRHPGSALVWPAYETRPS